MKSSLSLLLALAIGITIAATSGTAFAEAYLFEVLGRPAYYKSWNALFAGEEAVDSWLARYSKTRNGPAGPGTAVELGGTRYQLNTVCKPHGCGDNQFFVLFAPDGTKAWGYLLKGGKDERFFGSPDEEKRKVLRAAAHE